MNRRPYIFNGPAPGVPGQWFQMRAAKTETEPSEVMIYGQIGASWDGTSGISAKEFADEWAKLPAAQPVNLRIHSQGGSVFDGLAIYNLIAQRSKSVTAHIDGVALSAASFIAMAAGKVVMPKTARMMIHDAQGLSVGDSEEMRRMAELLDRESDRIADIYAAKTGKSRAKVRTMMQATTWMDGQEAVDLGFADEVTEHAAQNCSFDLSCFRLVPEALKKQTQSAAQNGGAKPTGEDKVNKSAILALLTQHGVKVANDATDQTILAELDKLATAGKVTNEEKTKLTTPPAAPVVPPAPPAEPQNVIRIEDFRALQNQLAAERERRITADFDRIVAENPSIDRAAWLPRVLKDETLLQNLATLPGRIIDPSRPSVSNQGNPLVEKYRGLKPGAERQALRLENHADLVRMARDVTAPDTMARSLSFFGPQNANTLAAALTPDYLADGLLIVARNKLAPLALFSTDFGVDRMKPRATVQVAKATVGATGQTNATNFESGDTTLAAVAVTVNQLTQSFHLTNDQLNKGHKLANLAGINADTFADMISDVWTALDVAGNFGAAQVVGAATAFSPSSLPAIFATAKNYRRRNLLLDGAYIGYLFPGVTTVSYGQAGIGQNGPNTIFGSMFGFDAIAMQNRWTGATANSVGFVCGPDAITAASGLPIGQPESEFISMQTVEVSGAGSNSTGLGLTVQICLWYSRASRTIWASYDVMFGAAAGETNQGKGLVSA